MIRYAQKVPRAMNIWTEVFADQQDRLVRVASSQHDRTDFTRYILDDADTPNWAEALATAPYVGVDIRGMGVLHIEKAFAEVRYLLEWKRRSPSTIPFCASTRPVDDYVSRRLTEYGGQPLDEAPRLRQFELDMAC